MRHSKLLCTLCLFVFVSTAAFGQEYAAQQAAIEQVLHDQQEAWNKGDIQTFMQGYKDSPETTFIGKTVARGYQPILKRYRTVYSTPEAMGHLDYSDLETRMLGPGYAVVTGKFHLTRSAAGGGDASGIYSLVFEREPEGWKIVLDHTSVN